MWARNTVEEETVAVRGEAIAKTEWIYSQAVEAWTETRVSRFLDVALVALRDRVRLSGAEVDLKLIHQQVNVSIASAEQVADTFAPMAAADFAAFAQAHADAQIKAATAAKALAPTEPPQVVDTPPLEAETSESWNETPIDDEPPARAIRHPRG